MGSSPTFEELGLSAELVKAVSDAGYTEPTPIQEQAIPYVLMARDLLGIAQTGTGKTASFTLPMIDVLASGRAKARMPRALIVEPTRELADQVAANFDKYGKYTNLTKALLIGGVSFEEQERLIDRGVDVLIATPGRLLDHWERGKVLLPDVKIFVIDEADRMLDMGFIPDVERIAKLLPPIRQTLLFSATMPPEVRRLADTFMINPKEIAVAPPATAAATVAQRLLVVEERAKRARLRNLIRSEAIDSCLIFCNRKRDVATLYESLKRHGFEAGALHGDIQQSVRLETLERFKRGEIRYLVCSDVAARGLDIQELPCVINFDVPFQAEDYVHRIGRTGRAGREGRAFTIAVPAETKYVRSIESLLGAPIPRHEPGDTDSVVALEQDDDRTRRRRRGGRSRGRGGRNGSPAIRDHTSADTGPDQPAAETGAAPGAESAEPSPTGLDAEAIETDAARGETESPFGQRDDVPAFLHIPLPGEKTKQGKRRSPARSGRAKRSQSEAKRAKIA